MASMVDDERGTRQTPTSTSDLTLVSLALFKNQPINQDCYTLHGDDALLVARELVRTPGAVTRMGELPSEFSFPVFSLLFSLLLPSSAPSLFAFSLTSFLSLSLPPAFSSPPPRSPSPGPQPRHLRGRAPLGPARGWRRRRRAPRLAVRALPGRRPGLLDPGLLGPAPRPLVEKDQGGLPGKAHGLRGRPLPQRGRARGPPR